MPRKAVSSITITKNVEPPRYAEITLYTTAPVNLAPTAPSATITWSTGAVAINTLGWSSTAPTQIASSDQAVYSSRIHFIDTTPPYTTTTATGSTPVAATNFSGLVSFTEGNFELNGATVTNIDGGNIATKTITATQIDVDTINIENMSAGNLSDTGVPTGTKKGVRIQDDGTFVAGDAAEYIRWDGSALSVQGNIFNITPNRIIGFAGDWFGITAATADFNLVPMLETLGGAGTYSFLLVGAGGGGASRNGSGSLHGGAGGGAASFVYDWNGTTTMVATVAAGGGGVNQGSNGGNGGDGGTSTFSIAGVIAAMATGGEGGHTGFAIGGIGSFPQGKGQFPLQAEVRRGGRGGLGFRGFQQTASGGGGGGVDAFGIAEENGRNSNGGLIGDSVKGGNCFGTNLGWLGDGTVVTGNVVLSTASPESLIQRGSLFTGGDGGTSSSFSGPGLGGGGGGTVHGGSGDAPGAAGGGSGGLFISRL